jgi:hypothetical protein
VQQLSRHWPQSLTPGPPGAQLAGAEPKSTPQAGPASLLPELLPEPELGPPKLPPPEPDPPLDDKEPELPFPEPPLDEDEDPLLLSKPDPAPDGEEAASLTAASPFPLPPFSSAELEQLAEKASVAMGNTALKVRRAS